MQSYARLTLILDSGGHIVSFPLVCHLVKNMSVKSETITPQLRKKLAYPRNKQANQLEA